MESIKTIPNRLYLLPHAIFSWFVVLLPPALYFYFVYSYSLNLPFADDFTNLSQAIRFFQSANFNEAFSSLFALGNGHRTCPVWGDWFQDTHLDREYSVGSTIIFIFQPLKGAPQQPTLFYSHIHPAIPVAILEKHDLGRIFYTTSIHSFIHGAHILLSKQKI